MPEEKYLEYCSKCIEYPFSRNPWCDLCYQKNGERPTAFWGLTDGDVRFFYKCDCGYETPRDISKSQAFSETVVEHFITDHKMHVSDAKLKIVEVMKKTVISKYLVQNPQQ